MQNNFSKEDEHFMKLALSLAKKGIGYTNPNPMVGAVLVKDGRVIGSGYHERCGEGHAEVNAFKNATEDVKGATLYVTLEPCSHYGKTPPCAKLIVEKKVARVVVAMTDPNELVSGRGIDLIREAGIEVEVGLLEEEAKKLNEVFLKYIVKKEPFVVLKTAMSLDGKIATKTGQSQWISCEESRRQVHELRNAYMGILVGVQTVIKDNPSLTCRIEGGKNPIRIVCDSHLRIPLDCNMLNDKKAQTIIATTVTPSEELSKKAKILVFSPDEKGQVPIKELVKKLGELGIDSILVEGGATIAYSFLKSGCVDKVLSYIAPKLIGGMDAKTSIGGEGISDLDKAWKLEDCDVTKVGCDFLISGYLKGES